jgi:serine/threonine protein kinase
MDSILSYDQICNALATHGYTLLSLLGRGGQGAVYLCKDSQTEERYAAKVSSMTHALQELQSLRSLWNPNVIYLYESFVECGVSFLIFEYCPGGSLADKILHKPIPRNELDPICLQLISALRACHAQHIAHLDIKPQNILIDKIGRVKLADFGTSQIINGGLSHQFKGSPAFLAPEIFRGQPYNPFKADVWSLGVTLYGIAAGTLPWADSLEKYLVQAAHGLGQVDPIIPKKLVKLLRLMIRPNPAERVSLNQIDLSIFDARPIKAVQRSVLPLRMIFPATVLSPALNRQLKQQNLVKSCTSYTFSPEDYTQPAQNERERI